ncbi:MAG: hypothetical protein IMW89_03405 [Ktedonobacteraceae bacterium]|nr:hypothetical protein [Ktedonobacteraceae bacterium]
MQRCISTNKAAQGRRLIIMKGLWWPSTQPGAQEVEDYREQVQSSLNQTQIGVHARRQLVTALLAASIVLAVYALYQWSMSLLLVVTGMALCAIAFHLLVSSNRALPLMSDQERAITAITHNAAPASLAESGSEQMSSDARTENGETAKRSENTKSTERSGETTQTGEIEQALALDFPQTPMPSMPSSPLIRVLETIDLSSSDVEHFIKTSEMEQKISEAAAEQAAKEGVHEDMP